MIDNKTFARYSKSPALFRSELIVDVDGSARRFGLVQDDWQKTDFAALDPALLRCAGRSKKPAQMRAYLERGRGHSKTTDLGTTAAWALAFATRPLRGYGYAADRDQSRLLLDAMQRLLRLNPWLGRILKVEANKIVNIAPGHPGCGSSLEIAASDVGSSYGILPDFVILDEITHWEENASALWESVISSAAKRSDCLLVCIANAGFVDSWQWNVREVVRVDSSWYFSRLEGPQASWLTPDRLAEQERLLPPVAFARLWGNQWSTGGGDALTEADINAAFKPELQYLPHKAEGWEFVAGLDLGVTRDWSAACILGIRKRNRWDETKEGHGRIRLAHTKVWKPARGKKINLQAVEDELRVMHIGYDLKAVNYDPWQATHMSQRLALLRLPMVEVPPTGSNLQRQATTLIEAFNDRRVDLYENDDLRRDLKRLRVEERSYGFRLVSPRDSSGHGDLGAAFSLALLAASEIAGDPALRAGLVSLELLDAESEWDQRQHDYQQEMARLSRNADDSHASQRFQQTISEILSGLRTVS